VVSKRVLRPLVGAVAAAAVLTACSTQPAPRACPSDPVLARAVHDLSGFTAWLHQHHVPGYVGEVGWPSGADSAQWNRVAQGWYAAADRAHLWVTAWAAAEMWPADYPLAAYRGSPGDLTLHVAGPQASVVVRHPSDTSYLRGVNVADGAFGADSPSYANTQVGRYGYDYRYDSAASFRYLASQGVRLVRLPFTWERVQPRLRAPLDRAEVDRLRSSVVAAHAAGLEVVLDLHGFGGYRTESTAGPRRVPLGDPALPTDDLADVWTRLSAAFAHVPGVAGYDLMNEPHDLPGDGPGGGAGTWQRASQQAVAAIRARGDHTAVMVEGYAWDAVAHWAAVNPHPWIQDPAANVRYEAHQYFDQDSSGTYRQSYATVRADDLREAGCSAAGFPRAAGPPGR
jgi:hypothetical protein